jgi:oligopeptide transport system permease protein
MLAYAARRLAALPLTLFIIVTLAFAVVRSAPGGPFDAEQSLPPQVKANLERAYGLDQPLALQYVRYLRGVVHGDFGPSLRYRDLSVRELIAQGLPVSLTLGFCALLFALAGGLPLGILAARRRGSVLDHGIMGLAVLGVALPSFVTGPLLVLVFGLLLHWLPVAGWQGGNPAYLILPVITLGLPLLAYVARLVRGSLLEVLQSDYIRAARARGLGSGRVIWRHALPAALLPVVSYLGPATAFVVTGSLVVETVFALPGTGRYLVDAAINRDYTLVMGMVIVYGLITLLCNLAADIAYGWLDPRIAHGD